MTYLEVNKINYETGKGTMNKKTQWVIDTKVDTLPSFVTVTDYNGNELTPNSKGLDGQVYTITFSEPTSGKATLNY